MPRSFDVFLSYSSRDYEWVSRFHRRLASRVNQFTSPDAQIFLDREDIKAGDRWEEAFLAAAGQSAVIVPVISPRFVLNENCYKEMKSFTERNPAWRTRIVPVKMLPTDRLVAPVPAILSTPQLQRLLAAIEYVSFFDGGTGLEYADQSPEYEAALLKVATAIAGMLNKDRAPRTIIQRFFDALPDQSSRPGLEVVAQARQAQVRIPTNRVRSGSMVQFRIAPSRPCHCYLFNLDPNGGVTLVLPNRRESDNRVVQIPSEFPRTSQITMESEGGMEYFMAVCVEPDLASARALMGSALNTQAFADSFWDWTEAPMMFDDLLARLRSAGGWWTMADSELTVSPWEIGS